MRGLRSVTVRGRAFLASGATAIVCGLFLIERDLVRMGLLVVALPLVSALYVAGRSHHLRVERTITPGRLTLGDTATVRVAITNGGAGTSVLLMEEQLPYALGGRPRFVVQPMPRDGHEVLEYSVRPEVRGRHAVGPMQVRLREPFGLVEVREEVPGTSQLLVTPRVQPLTEIKLTGGWFVSGEDHPRSFSVGRVADVVVREYRRGDDLRRVHWRSTARMGELMVRNEEQLWQARATVVLDTRSLAHRGTGPGSSFEAAVSAAASVTAHLTSQGYQVRLVAGSEVTEVWHERGQALDPYPVLERLAVVELSGDTDLPDPGRGPGLGDDLATGIVVGLVGATRPDDQRFWARFPRHGAQGFAIVLDVEGWGQRATEAPTAEPDRPVDPWVQETGAARDVRWLTGQGWRTSTLRKGGSLAASWRELDR